MLLTYVLLCYINVFLTYTVFKIPHHAFFEAAKGIRKQITEDVVASFQRWREINGVSEA